MAIIPEPRPKVPDLVKFKTNLFELKLVRKQSRSPLPPYITLPFVIFLK